MDRSSGGFSQATGNRSRTPINDGRLVAREFVRDMSTPSDKDDLESLQRDAGGYFLRAANPDNGLIAMETAGITLIKGDLKGIVRARCLSRATVANIRQNLFLAFIYNVVSIPVTAGLLYPLTGWLLSSMLASLAMSLSSVSVIMNALRLRKTRL